MIVIVRNSCICYTRIAIYHCSSFLKNGVKMLFVTGHALLPQGPITCHRTLGKVRAAETKAAVCLYPREGSTQSQALFWMVTKQSAWPFSREVWIQDTQLTRKLRDRAREESKQKRVTKTLSKQKQQGGEEGTWWKEAGKTRKKTKKTQRWKS